MGDVGKRYWAAAVVFTAAALAIGLSFTSKSSVCQVTSPDWDYGVECIRGTCDKVTLGYLSRWRTEACDAEQRAWVLSYIEANREKVANMKADE